MIIDDVIWEIINNGHCSFKTKTETNVFCSDPNNVTGLCNRNSCPLANSRYATVYEEKGVCYLKMKTAERAHTPKDLWESIKLDPSYNKALEQIDNELQYWPNFLKHKCKQRFTRIRQVLVKRRKIKLEGSQEYQVVSRKAEKREGTRLVKAEKSAVIENHITEELLKNLKKGKYDQIYNYPNKVLDKVIEKEHVLEDNELDEDYNEDDFDKGYIESFSDEEGEEDDDGADGEDPDDKQNKDEDDSIDDIFNVSSSKTGPSTGSLNKKRKRGKKEKIEYEREREYEVKDKVAQEDI